MRQIVSEILNIVRSSTPRKLMLHNRHACKMNDKSVRLSHCVHLCFLFYLFETNNQMNSDSLLGFTLHIEIEQISFHLTQHKIKRTLLHLILVL